MARGGKRTDDRDGKSFAKSIETRIGRAPGNKGRNSGEVALQRMSKDLDARLVALGFRLDAGRTGIVAPDFDLAIGSSVFTQKLRRNAWASGGMVELGMNTAIFMCRLRSWQSNCVEVSCGFRRVGMSGPSLSLSQRSRADRRRSC